MSKALKCLQELKARTKAPCINPDCQDGHMCSIFGECCAGCYATGEARRHLSNLRIEYFEGAVEVMESRDDPTEILHDIEEDAKRALGV